MDKDKFESLIGPYIKKEETEVKLADGTSLIKYEIAFRKKTRNHSRIKGLKVPKKETTVLPQYEYITEKGTFRFKELREAYPDIKPGRLRVWSQNGINGFSRKEIKDEED